MAVRLAEWNGARNWVIASAAEVYGRIEGRGTEAAPLRPVIPYGAAKAAVERIFTSLPAERVVILRIGEVYGPGSTLLNQICSRLSAGMCPWPGAGRVPVSFVHVDDVAAAFIAAASRAAKGVSVFNVADATPSSWRAFLLTAAGRLQTRPPVFLPLWLAQSYAAGMTLADRLAGRAPLATRHTVQLLTTPKPLSIARIVTELEFTPRHRDIGSGLEACLGLSHHRQNGGPQRAAAHASA